MTKSFAEFVGAERPDSDTVQQAGRYYLAEKTGYLSPEKMQERLVEVTRDPAKVDSALHQFQRDSAAVENALMAMFSAEWELGPAEQDRIIRSFTAARTKLPVIELGIIAIVAMYGMYLVATGGKKEETVVNKDGSYRTVKYEPPTGPIKELVALVKKGIGAG
jgi:hypothetical protein